MPKNSKKSFQKSLPCIYLLGLTSGIIFAIICSAFLSDSSSSPKDNQFYANYQKKVVFVSFTMDSIVEVPILLKLAQALYPVRHNVIWIVVSGGMAEISLVKNLNASYISAIGNRRFKKCTARLRLIDKLKRYGIPFVHLYSNSSNRFDAYGIGLNWAWDNLDHAILIFGPEEHSYNYNIFKQALETNILSAWATGLSRDAGFSSPIYSKESKATLGHFDGFVPRWNFIQLEREHGSFAINLQYLKDKYISRDRIIQLANDQQNIFPDLKIPIESVQFLKNNDRILVWRTKLFRARNPWNILLKTFYKDTNMFALWKDVFGQQLETIEVVENVTDKVHKVYL